MPMPVGSLLRLLAVDPQLLGRPGWAFTRRAMARASYEGIFNPKPVTIHVIFMRHAQTPISPFDLQGTYMSKGV